MAKARANLRRFEWARGLQRTWPKRACTLDAKRACTLDGAPSCRSMQTYQSARKPVQPEEASNQTYCPLKTIDASLTAERSIQGLWFQPPGRKLVNASAAEVRAIQDAQLSRQVRLDRDQQDGLSRATVRVSRLVLQPRSFVCGADGVLCG